MTDVPEPAPALARPAPLDGLGPRALRRMTPRVGVTLAGTGGFIAVAGALGIGGDQLTTDDGDIQRIPGVLISLAIIAVGLLALRAVRTGPLATAASIAVAVGIPALLVFTTVDDADFPPFSFDAVLLLSTLAWAVAYAVGPARGRMVMLTLALVFAPIFVMEQVEEISGVPEAVGAGLSQMFGGGAEMSESYTFDEEGNVVFDDGFEAEGDEFDFEGAAEPDFPDPTNLGAIALVFGVVYLVGSHLLSRREYLGVGTPLASVGAFSTLAGLAFLSDDLQEIGTGVLLVVIGLAVIAIGASAARRFTTWFGGLFVGQGVLVLVTKALGDDASMLTASLVFLLIGLVVVFAAHLLSAALAEAPEEDEARSFGPETRRGPDTGPALEDEIFAP